MLKKSLLCTLFLHLVFTVTQSNSQSDNTAAVIGGVVTVVVVLIVSITTAVTVVIVVLLRNRRGHNSSGPQKKYVISLYVVSLVTNILFLYRDQMSAVDITAKSNEAYELTKLSREPTYMSVYQWFNVWKHGQPLHVLSCLYCLQ